MADHVGGVNQYASRTWVGIIPLQPMERNQKNIQQPMEEPAIADACAIGCSMLGVGCWMFCLYLSARLRIVGNRNDSLRRASRHLRSASFFDLIQQARINAYLDPLEGQRGAALHTAFHQDGRLLGRLRLLRPERPLPHGSKGGAAHGDGGGDGGSEAGAREWLHALLHGRGVEGCARWRCEIRAGARHDPRGEDQARHGSVRHARPAFAYSSRRASLQGSGE